MYSRYEELIKERGYSNYRVAKETGISQVTLSDWKNGKITPKIGALQKIADLLNVSLDYLVGIEAKEEPTNYYLNDETAKIAQQIFDNKELKILFDAAKDVSPQDLKLVYEMTKRLKDKEGSDN